MTTQPQTPAPPRRTPLLTYADAAEELGISVWKTRQLAAQRKLVVVRLGHRTVRIRPVDLEKCKERLAR